MFRFSIRDMLWLTVVVALTVGWNLQQRSWTKERLELRANMAGLKRNLKTKSTEATALQIMLDASRKESRDSNSD